MDSPANGMLNASNSVVISARVERAVLINKRIAILNSSPTTYNSAVSRRSDMFRRSALALIIVLIVAFTSTRFPAAQTATVPGTVTMTGTVESATPYTAAQVFIRNTDKRMLYMVYTNAKRFRASALFPGNYEISAATRELKSDVQRLSIKPGESPKVTLTFAQPAAAGDRAIVNANE